jgi:hypothetical protein
MSDAGVETVSRISFTRPADDPTLGQTSLTPTCIADRDKLFKAYHTAYRMLSAAGGSSINGLSFKSVENENRQNIAETGATSLPAPICSMDHGKPSTPPWTPPRNVPSLAELTRHRAMKGARCSRPSCHRKATRSAFLASQVSTPEPAVAGALIRVPFPARPGAEGEPVNETFVIEEIKLKAIGSPAEVLSRYPAPKATMPHLRKLIRRRMSFHYGQKKVQTVRLVDVNNEEVYHWTWFQEQVRREKIGRRQFGRRA